MEQTNSEIDKSLYSRQLYVIGKDAQEAVKNTSVLISGLSGLGIEIAKNLILTGVKSVTLHDTGNIRLKELSTNFYAGVEDVGKPRIYVKDKLTGLNPYVSIYTSTDLLGENLIKKHQIIIVCDRLPQSLTTINDICRQYRTKFIIANTIGLMGSIFCDFGEGFITNDINGETPSTGILLQHKNGVFFTNEEQKEPHKLYVGDKIIIKTGDEQYTDEVTKVIDAYKFKTQKEIADQLFVNATFTQLKNSVTINFKNLSESLVNPEFSNVYTEDFNRQSLLHNFMFSFTMFVSKYGSYPRPWNDEDAKEILLSVKCVNESQTDCIKKLCYCSSGKTVVMDSMVGSIVAQEVVKACSKKYTPINQWLFVERTDILSDEKIGEDDFVDIPENRYFGQTLIFGKSFQKKIEDSSIFIVGAGAIGCEHMKNAAMMGIKNITITDMDRIEKSNLSRQFLFRYSDIGKFKSESARNAILAMNPDINVTAQQIKVSSDTVNIYNRHFFNKFTCVLTALDNVDARKCVDNLCLQYSKHLIDSGTLGTKGNTQVVIPYVTETYSQSSDPPEKEFAVCTLKHFPYLIEHCIQWARDMFEGLFVKAPQNFLEYKKNPTKIRNMASTELAGIVTDINFVRDNFALDGKECIKFAYKLWHENFRDQIYHLIQKFPANHQAVDEATGEKIPYWTGSKKFPKVINFSSTELELAFIEATANLWAEVCLLNEEITQKKILQFTKKANPPKIIEQTQEIAGSDKEQKELDEQAKGKPLNELLDMLPSIDDISEINVNILEFEKDDDTNFHVDFISSTSNLRATNYNIQNVDKFKVKGIAGRIIPAVVTTTSLVSGLVFSEFIKVVRGEKRIEKYYNTFSNLALPVLAFSEPIKVAKTKKGDLEYSIWDNLEFGDLTIKQLIEQIEEKINDNSLAVVSVTIGTLQLFSSFHSASLIKKRMGMKISEIYKSLSKDEDMADILQLTVYIEKKDESDNENENNDTDNNDESLVCNIKLT